MLRAALLSLLILAGHAPTADDSDHGRILVEVTVTPTSDGARLDYRLAQPVRRFDFERDAPISDQARLRIVAGDVTLGERAVVGAAPFDSFSLIVQPDLTRHDATYPLLVRVGEGRVLYATALSGERAAFDTRLLAPRGLQLLGQRGDGGMVYVGPRAQVRRQGGIVFVAAQETPRVLVEATASDAVNLFRHYRTLIGRAPQMHPIVILDAQTGHRGFGGDVTPNGVVLLQQGVDAPDERRAFRLLAHEFFHLWNNGLQESDGENARWLVEGSAEYAAALATRALRPEWDDLDAKLTAVWMPCLVTLSDESLVGLTGQRRQSTRYSCGLIAHWLLDLELRRTSRDFWEVWRQTLSSRGGRYELEHFRRIADPAGYGFTALVDDSGGERWRRIVDWIRMRGVAPAEVTRDEDLRAAAIATLLRSACAPDSAVGYEIGQEHSVRLDTNETCGSLAGHPQLLAIEGHALSGSGAALYQAVTERCAAEGSIAVQIERNGSRTAAVRCARGAVTPRQSLAIQNALPAAH